MTESVLAEFVAACRAALGDDLRALVLFGSAAEGRLRPASDVNLLVLLARFEAARVDGLREPVRIARAAIDLHAMFLLESELTAAVESFAVKLGDILRRRRVLFGPDPLAGIRIPRRAALADLRQSLLNLLLRLRAGYIESSLRDEQAARLLAEFAGGLRAAAATLAELSGEPAASPRDALERAATASGVAGAAQAMALLSQARTTPFLGAGIAARALLTTIGVVEAMRARAEALHA